VDQVGRFRNALVSFRCFICDIPFSGCDRRWHLWWSKFVTSARFPCLGDLPALFTPTLDVCRGDDSPHTASSVLRRSWLTLQVTILVCRGDERAPLRRHGGEESLEPLILGMQLHAGGAPLGSLSPLGAEPHRPSTVFSGDAPFPFSRL
jgi:hypothetical protein